MITNEYSLNSNAESAKRKAKELGHGPGTLLYSLCEYMQVTAFLQIEPDKAFMQFERLHDIRAFKDPSEIVPEQQQSQQT